MNRKPAVANRAGQVQGAEALPEAHLDAWQSGPAFPGATDDAADESPADQLPASTDADQDTSEPLLQDLFAGLEQRSVPAGNGLATSTAGACRLSGLLCTTCHMV